MTAGFAAVRHILTSTPIASWTRPYIRENDFDWSGLLVEAEARSGGELFLVLLAYDLWEAKGIVGVSEIADRLDRSNFHRVLEALAISRGEGLRLEAA